MGKSSYSCLPNVFIRWCFSLVARWFLQILASGVCGLLHRSPCSLTSVPCSEVKCACYALWRIKLIVSNITADLGCGLITGESWASRPKWFKRKRWTEGNEGECQKAHSMDGGEWRWVSESSLFLVQLDPFMWVSPYMIVSSMRDWCAWWSHDSSLPCS